ncbi:hypothetical protein DNHGIG_25350 [Collibacillus ludicampi]|uniref:SHSP domain-containing protein n=1 Tax=Collibacillus ludicampi TaxID=2771369 RepID=A0AAV4LGN2_9BACL|nr:Hsp20/alpha crystallin family protein [Collibacillus ludicampi]GIM46986.1 hypothetical protein DNHGIG_25350 [Collibacillus ludicampi]
MNDNPFEPLKNLGHMTEQLRQVFGDDFVSKLIQIPQPNFPMMNHIPFGSDIFNGQKTNQWPRIDVFHTRSEVVVVSEIPGLQSESDVNLYVEGRQLKISGSLPSRYGHIGRDRFILSEIRYGAFERAVNLPFPIRSDRMKARYRQGILEVRLLKDQNDQSWKKGQHVPILFE